MKILDFSIHYSLNSNTLYSDLNEELVRRGHEVTVVFAGPSLEAKKYELTEKNGVRVLRVKTGKLQQVSYLKKFISFHTLIPRVKAATKEVLGGEDFDLITFSAPPLTFTSVVAWAKKYFNCPVFLAQKDIFPQNAVDLNLFSKYNPVYHHFRRQEKQMFKTADYIGCMSQGNIDFILKHNKFLDTQKVVYFPNTQLVEEVPDKSGKLEIRKKYSIPTDACVFLFGGNMGLPQYLKLTCSAMKHFNGRKDIFWFTIGRGTHAHLFEECIAKNSLTNACYYPQLPREEFHKIAAACDLGLVTLDPRYTIPNIPSKTLSYMSMELPILAATDTSTDYGKLIESDAKCGLWCSSADENAFFNLIEKFAKDENLRRNLGANGRKYMEENFNVGVSAKILESLFAAKKR